MPDHPTDDDGVEPGAPSDNDNLVSVLADLAAEGYDDEVFARPGGRVKWAGCGHEAPAAELEVEVLRRLEGASDPADMMAVYGVRCQECDKAGALVLHYGPMATEEEADVLLALPDHLEERQP